MGRVVEVHSGDSLSVERENDQKVQRVFLSSVKAPAYVQPRVGKDGQEEKSRQSEPYGWESKEGLRKIAIGKKVSVEMEYDREVPLRQGGNMMMNFGAVTDVLKNRNFAVYLLEKGLLKTNIRQSGDNASKYLELLLAAEKKASDGKLCLHNKSKDAPITAFSDLS